MERLVWLLSVTALLLLSLGTDPATGAEAKLQAPVVLPGGGDLYDAEGQENSGAQWNKIDNIVEAILQFDEKPEFQNEFFNFKDSSQEAAIIDGVLVENGSFTYNTLSSKWELITPTAESHSDVLWEIPEAAGPSVAGVGSVAP